MEPKIPEPMPHVHGQPALGGCVEAHADEASQSRVPLLGRSLRFTGRALDVARPARPWIPNEAPHDRWIVGAW